MGLAITAYIAINKAKAVDVVLYSSKRIDSLWLKTVESNSLEPATNYKVTFDPKEAFCDADIILVTYPAFLRKKFILENQRFIKSKAMIGFVPGYGGAEYLCVDLINRGVTVFGLQRVPYVARACFENEKVTAGILSSKKELFICSIPISRTGEVANVIGLLLDIPVVRLKEYLSITLAPSNPLLHITGLYNVFKNHTKSDVFSSQLRFYEEWNDSASELLFQYDHELQEICSHLSPLDMTEVVSLPLYYESPTPQKMTRKLKSIESFKAVMVPLKRMNDGYIIDLESRMFIEDFPFGVCIIKDFARMLGVKTPVVDSLLNFYYSLSGNRYFDEDGNYTNQINETGIPGNYGLHSLNEIIDFYHR